MMVESLCASFKNKDYYLEKHNWINWYKLTKELLHNCDDKRQKELMLFIAEQIRLVVDDNLKAIQRIVSQQYMLEINDIYNKKLDEIVGDFRFEFEAARFVFENYDTYSSDEFWKALDALNSDLKNTFRIG